WAGGLTKEAVGVATAPSGRGITALLLEPAWYASTPPISRPSVTGTASWAATGAKPLLRMSERLEQTSWHYAGNLESQILCGTSYGLITSLHPPLFCDKSERLGFGKGEQECAKCSRCLALPCLCPLTSSPSPSAYWVGCNSPLRSGYASPCYS